MNSFLVLSVAPETTVPAVVVTAAPKDDVREDLKPLKKYVVKCL